jgi:Tfp pilus assembly protein PilF
LHKHGLVHRDIKPSNVIFVNGVPKLGDIGLVTEAGDTHSIVGTEGYLPPEGPGEPQADIFSLGKVLYEISTGRDRRRFPELPEDLRSWPDRLAIVEFNEILLKTCAKDAAKRYPSANELGKDLERLQGGKSLRRVRVQKRIGWLAGAVTVCALLGFASVELLTMFRRSSGHDEKNWTRWTTNRMAWDAYVRAGNIGNNLTASTHTNALVEYERAVSIDPNFAYARAEMALQMVCNRYGGMPAEPALARAKAEAKRALAQDASLSTAWHALAGAAAAEHDLAGAEQNYTHALQANPRDSFSHMDLANFLINCGRLEEARQHLEAALRINPSWPNTPIFLGRLEMLQGHFKDAIRLVDSGIALQPNRAFGYVVRGDIRWVQRQSK